MSYIVGMDVTKVRPALVPGNAGTGAEFRVGTIGMTSDAKKYKYVKFNNGVGDVASVAGNVAYYYAVSGDGVSGGYENSEVTMDLTDGLIGAGVFQAVIADGGFGWIQIKGKATLTTALTAGADGNALTAIGTTDGTLDVSAAVTDAIVAFATDISAKKVVCDFPE